MPYRDRRYHNQYCLERENRLYNTNIQFRQKKSERSRLYQQKMRNCARGCYHNTTLKDYKDPNREFSFVINFN